MEDKGELVMKENVSEFLEEVDIVNLPSTGKFVVSDHFTITSKAVKIADVSAHFINNFFSKVEEPKNEVILRRNKTKKAFWGEQISGELGDKAETTLADIWELLKKQPNGESGKLCVNGMNIFFVRSNVRRGLIMVFLYLDIGGWYIFDSSVYSPNEWGEGIQVFSRHRTEA